MLAAEPKSAPIPSFAAADLKHTRVLFTMVCAYVAAQAYLIPLATVGPSWAVWPVSADIAVLLIVATSFHRILRTSEYSPANRDLWRLLLIATLGCAASYVLLTLLTLELRNSDGQGITWGLFQLLRLGEFLIIFLAAARLPLTEKRLKILREVTTFALLAVCVGVCATYFSVIHCSEFAPQLPADFATAGPWATYAFTEEKGWSTVGYNHAYTAAQVLLLVAMRSHLEGGRKSAWSNPLMCLCLFSTFASGSRAGFAVMFLYVLLTWVTNPRSAIFIVFLFLTIIVGAAMLPREVLSELSFTSERQVTVLGADDAENLSGRDQIWLDRLEFLNAAPLRWLIGEGFGCTLESGNFAHMQYLEVILETGLLGLAVFCLLCRQIVTSLLRFENRSKPLFWMTVCMLISALSQETFYPVPAMGHFIGLYLCCIAIALRKRQPSIAQMDKSIARTGAHYAGYHRHPVLQRRANAAR